MVGGDEFSSAEMAAHCSWLQKFSPLKLDVAKYQKWSKTYKIQLLSLNPTYCIP